MARRDTDRRPAPGSWPRLVRGLIGGVVAAVAVAACSDSTGVAHAPAPPVRPASEPVTASSTTTTAPGSARRSEPYWVSVADFKGTGAATTTPFTIAGDVLQWRVTYHCQTSPFGAVALDQSGDPLERPLADAAGCASAGKGYATDPGAFTLRITTAGTWDLAVEQQMDGPLVEPLSPTLASVPLEFTATVHGVDRQGEGSVKVYRLGDGSRVIRLDDFFTTINSDLELRLSPLPDPRTTEEITAAPFVSLAPLKATLGSMSYPVPANVDISAYRSIVIWCEITRNAYAAAGLQPAG